MVCKYQIYCDEKLVVSAIGCAVNTAFDTEININIIVRIFDGAKIKTGL